MLLIGLSGLADAAVGLAMRPVLTPCAPVRSQVYFVLRVAEALAVLAACAYFLTSRSQWNDYTLPAYALSAVAGLVLTPVLLTSRLVPRSLSVLGIAGYALLLAGVICNLLGITDIGWHVSPAASHLAAFLLTGLVLDRLKGSAPARIVTVSSNTQAEARLNFDDLQGERSYSGQRAYSQSKLANVVFTYELACRLEGTGVTATALHPGLVRTSFSAEDPSRLSKVMIPLLRPFMKAPARAAATSIYLASAPEAEGVTGRYFASRKPETSSKASYDTAAAARLWQISADLTGLNTRGPETQRRGT